MSPLKSAFKLPWTPVAGDFAPEWSATADSGKLFTADSAPGRPVLLCFLSGSATETEGPLLEELAVHTWELDGLGCSLRVFSPTSRTLATPLPFPLLIDENSTIARAFNLPLAQRVSGEPAPRAILVGADGRIIDAINLEISHSGAQAALRLVQIHAPFTAMRILHPPILHLPKLFSPEICRMLIDVFHAGNPVAGKMIRMREGKALHVVDADRKQRLDIGIPQPMREWIWQQLLWRMVPAARKAFHFDITRFEYLQIGRYTAEDSGHFVAHRDDGNAGNAHRRFAMTANLSADYDGGELSFPEYGASYRPGAGDAILFSCSLLHEAMTVTRGERFMLVGMFWGEDEVAQFERSRALRVNAPKPKLTPSVVRNRQIIGTAQTLREIAGDVAAFGPYLDGKRAESMHISERIDTLRRQLARLRDDIRNLRRPYLNGQIKKLELSEKPEELRLHIGCGGHRLSGWINIDVSGGDLRMDLRWPLPFPDNSVRYIFASHVVEHVYRHSELPALLAEIRRVLQPGGVLRAIVPDIEKCIQAYAGRNAEFFAERAKTWAWAANCKTPLDHFLGYAGANQAFESFGGHKYGYDLETLSLALREAGFSKVERSFYMQSAHDTLRVDEHSHNATANVNGDYYSLFVEATK